MQNVLTHLDLMSNLYAGVRAGWTEATTDTVKRVLGREPISFKQFVTDYKNDWLSETPSWTAFLEYIKTPSQTVFREFGSSSPIWRTRATSGNVPFMATIVPNPISKILETQAVVVLDGALATELERRGCDLNNPLWSARVLLESPDLIFDVHADYFMAGADCATTASYQATFEGFARRGLDAHQATELMRLSVQLALDARDAFWAEPTNRVGRARPFVAASVGPYGAFLADGSEYRGDYRLTEAELMDFHRPRMAVLAESGADVLACETIPCLLEARAILRVLEEFPTMTAWFSFSARDGTHTNHGEPITDCAALLGTHPQVAAMGVNCTAPEFVSELVQNAHAGTSKPILAYPNSGETYDATHKHWHGESSCAPFTASALEWYANGARVIGGCCRTTPEHIRELAAALRA